MHDPKVVAHELVLPIPIRGWKHRDARKAGDYRWGTRRRRRTNPENLGEPVFPWYRLTGWESFRIAGESFRWCPLGTIWHNEPDGKDGLTVCRYRITDDDGKVVRFSSGWKWHVHHWSFQWFFEQKARRWLFERCRECGLRYPWGYAPVSHSWGEPKSRWFKVEVRSYHHKCSALVHARRKQAGVEQVVREVVGLLSADGGPNEAEIIGWLTGHDSPITEWRHRYELERLFGYERDEAYELIKAATK